MKEDWKLPGPIFHLPRDEDDERFVKSFSLHEQTEMKAFFEEYGFVVVRDVLDKEECNASVQAMFDIMESCVPSFKRNDTETWIHSPWPKKAMEKYGSISRDPVFHPQFLKNRQNANIYKAFEIILGSQNLRVNHDRVCFMRPTKNVCISKEKNIYQDMEVWRTEYNLHLDMNPYLWINDGSISSTSSSNSTTTTTTTSTSSSSLKNNKKSMKSKKNETKVKTMQQKSSNSVHQQKRSLEELDYSHPLHLINENNIIMKKYGVQVQSILNFLDNLEEDGGFIIVPGFFKYFETYFTKYVTKEVQEQYKQNNSVSFQKGDALTSRSMRIPARAGSLIIWNQLSPHGTAPNYSPNIRCAQLMRMFPGEMLKQENAMLRSKLISSLIPNGFQVTDVGRIVFDVKTENSDQ